MNFFSNLSSIVLSLKIPAYLIIYELLLLGGAIVRGRRDDQGRVVSSVPTCTTPSGGRGKCRDIQACPLLLGKVLFNWIMGRKRSLSWFCLFLHVFSLIFHNLIYFFKLEIWENTCEKSQNIDKLCILPIILWFLWIYLYRNF